MTKIILQHHNNLPEYVAVTAPILVFISAFYTVHREGLLMTFPDEH